MLSAAARPGRRPPRVFVVVWLAGALTVGSAVALYTPAVVALFALTMLGLVAVRPVDVPAGLYGAYGAALLVAAWSNPLELYESIWWWDLAVHAVTPGIVAVVLLLVLVRRDVLPAPSTAPTRRRVGSVLLVTGLGTALAVLWELTEWAGHSFVADSINVGYVDTMGDLAVGGLGAVVAGVLVTRSRTLARRRTRARSGSR
ncbi:hypothetical protein [Cellulomonas fimi]|uniref:DUF2238 domain-containing protein n=1 Tax=Cellulomonas fimi TaxID=1708 RepID=A0A7Y0LZ89_CELFI|nr:hypothetical protein [Cellulomonas fimi]NMR19447.1 hypothetical protein [Cellulomonas fimi]